MKKAIIIILEFINAIDLIILTNGFKKVLWTEVPVSGVLAAVLISYAVIFHVLRLLYLYNNAEHKNILKVLQTIVLLTIIILFFTVKLTFEYNSIYNRIMFDLYLITIAIDAVAMRNLIKFNKEAASDT